MKNSESLSLLSNLINFAIFVYFILNLLRLNILDLQGLFISAFGISISIIANIVSVLESRSIM